MNTHQKVPEINQAWFELAKVRRHAYNSGTVWIPLRAAEEIVDVGQQGHDGYVSDYFGLGSLAVPIQERDKGEHLDWGDLGINHWHSSYVHDDGVYVSAEQYDNGHDALGLRLVIEQHIEGDGYWEWYIHHDLLIALGLKREGDLWVNPAEGYEEVIRLLRGDDNKPRRVEIRARYLKDYLSARRMALRISLYRGRTAILNSRECVDWPESLVTDNQPNDRWEGRVDEIHEGGMSYGSEMAVFHAGRTEADEDVDVPDFNMSEGVTSQSWTRKFSGPKLYRIQGEVWKDEWVEPSDASYIVTGERLPTSTPFIVNEKAERETGTTLVKGVRWLWFRPEVVAALLQYRGSFLGWYTRYTGTVKCSPVNPVDFGINPLGLVNVFAKDIGQLPEWQQQIWAAYNVGPEGGVSDELLASQSRAEPAGTQAPEAYLENVMDRLNAIALAKLGYQVLQDHSFVGELLPKVHRFRSLTEDGLRALAKDLARLVVDRIDAGEIQKTVAPPKGEKWGGLKSLDRLLATKVGDARAYEIMGPLHGIYQLRLTDAHLPSEDLADAFRLADIDPTKPFVHQGLDVLVACVGRIHLIGEIVKRYF
jgi:hypothetical protein